ncbi:MAG TPA: HAD family acid phosphatase [Devosiaceae bacterium]|jgi:acid phosphatase
MTIRSAYLPSISTALMALLLAAPALAADLAAPPAPGVPQNDNLNAVLWDQTSVEFKANALGAYALGRLRLDEALADKNWTADPKQTGAYQDLPPAIILDVDDTVLNTSAYQAWTVANGTAYSGKTWTDYVNAKKDVAIPGAVDFLKYADSKGVKIFYVTNRTKDEEGPTVEEMTEMGFPMGGNVDTFLSAKEQPDWGSAKGTRRAYIAKDYRTMLLFGDNLGDFTDDYSASVADRDKVYEANMAHWGHDWIALPNPTYGSFESSPYMTDYSKSVDEQRQLKLDALVPWAGPSQ